LLAPRRNRVAGRPFVGHHRNERAFMKYFNLLTLLLVIIGGLNWGLVGSANFDLVAYLFGGETATLSRVVYVLVGLSALWQLVPFLQAAGTNSAYAEQRAESRRI
jgi:hypothetical protein